MGHNLSSAELRRLPKILNHLWSTNSHVARSSKSLCNIQKTESDSELWPDVEIEFFQGEDSFVPVSLDGPHDFHLNVYRGWFEFWNCTRYRLGFMPFPEISEPLRLICREMATSVGAGYVMYLPEWAIEGVASKETYVSADAEDIRQLLIAKCETFLDLTSVPDDQCLESFALERTPVEWPYFIEFVTTTCERPRLIER